MTKNELGAALKREQLAAYRYFRLAKVRRWRIVKLLDQAALLRRMLVASLLFNALLAVLWAFMAALLAGGAK